MQIAIGIAIGILAALAVQAAVERTIDKWQQARTSGDRSTMPIPRMVGNIIVETVRDRQEGAVLEPPDDHAQAVDEKIAQADAEGRDLKAEELL